VQDSDHVASGDDGFKKGLNGSSTRDAGTWVSGHVYEQGEVVTYLGDKYVAKNVIEDATTNPAANTAEWNPYTASGGASKTSQRINQYMNSGPGSATGEDLRERADLADGQRARSAAAAARHLGRDQRHRRRGRQGQPPRQGRPRALRHRRKRRRGLRRRRRRDPRA
jgi:hypothetical protein